MSKTKPIRGEKGQFKGSIPTVMPSPPNPEYAVASGLREPDLRDAASLPLPRVYDAFRGQAKPAARRSDSLPEWAALAPFPTLNSVIGKNDMYRLDHVIEESTRVSGDRERSVLVKRETADLFLKAQEVERQERAPGNWRAVYVYPTYVDADGSCLATEVEKGDFGSSTRLGVLTPEGEFVAQGAHYEYLKDRIGEPGCPLYDATEGYVDDWQCTVQANDDYAVAGLHIKVACEEVEVDDSYLEDPDSAWDSRFD